MIHKEHALSHLIARTKAANEKETVKFARLKDDLELSFFTATFDERPESTFVIHGYYLEEHEADDGNSAIFEISHRSQFRSDRHEHSIKFRVDREDSRKKWPNALNRALTTTKE
ncbi:unnamed protein product, partial [Mesorhabditis belari]|uniref:PH domain-containing protein n=1 Tax=Mesorhabditis belari TaxID=2138241 RepID=A0AAF3ETM9_9BILA